MNGFTLKPIALTLVLLSGLASSLIVAANPITISHNLSVSASDASQSMLLTEKPQSVVNKKSPTSLGCMACHQRSSATNKGKAMR